MVLLLLLASCESVEGTWTGECDDWASEIDVTYQSLGSVDGEFLLQGIAGEGGGGFDGDQLKMLFQVAAPTGEHYLARLDGVVSGDEMEADVTVERNDEEMAMECTYERD